MHTVIYFKKPALRSVLQSVYTAVLMCCVLLALPYAPIAYSQTDDCTFAEPDSDTWLIDGPVLTNQSGNPIPMLGQPNTLCTTDLADVQPGGQVVVLVDQGDFLFIRHINDNFRNAWVQKNGFVNAQIEPDCTFFEPDASTWQIDGLILTNQSANPIPMLGRPDTACTTDLADIQPGGQVRVLVDQGDYLYIRHIDDNFTNAWVQSTGFSNETIPVDPITPTPPTGPTVSGNTISWPDDGWYEVQAVTDTGINRVCAGTRFCEVAAGNYIVINHTSGVRFENVVVSNENTGSGITVTGNSISWPDDGWYQVQAITAEGVIEVCAGTRFCEVPDGTYIIINHTTGQRFEPIVVDDNAAGSDVTVSGNTIFWPDDGWYQVQAVTDTAIVEVCAGTRFCEVAAGNYIVINHTTGVRFENVVVSNELTGSDITVTDNTISWPDNGWYQVQALTAEGIIEVCAGTRFCEVPNGSYIIINHTTGERFEPVIINTDSAIQDPNQDPTVPETEQRVIPTTDVRPFLADGPYAQVLSTCAFPGTDIVEDDICTLATLPFIGQTTDVITVEDVLARTLVSHDWMGERLGQLLRAMPADMLPLFAPVTTVVIGSEVRPSEFNFFIGRMSIDPSFLWKTVPEKRTVSQADDFRSNYGADLRFVSSWRLMRGDEYAIPFYSLTDESTRP